MRVKRDGRRRVGVNDNRVRRREFFRLRPAALLQRMDASLNRQALSLSNLASNEQPAR